MDQAGEQSPPQKHCAVTTAYHCAQVEPTTHLPLYSIGLSALISLLLGLLTIRSSVAFHDTVSLGVAAYFGPYSIPLSIVLYKGTIAAPLQIGPVNLRKRE